MTDELIAFGSEVKALEDGKVGGYLIRFTKHDEPDLEADPIERPSGLVAPRLEVSFGMVTMRHAPSAHAGASLVGPHACQHAVVEKLDPPEIFEWFVELRRRLGMHVVPLGPGAGAAVARALRDNHVVCLLSDRDLSRDGPEVEFFGELTTLPAGPAAQRWHGDCLATSARISS